MRQLGSEEAPGLSLSFPLCRPMQPHFCILCHSPASAFKTFRRNLPPRFNIPIFLSNSFLFVRCSSRFQGLLSLLDARAPCFSTSLPGLLPLSLPPSSLLLVMAFLMQHDCPKTFLNLEPSSVPTVHQTGNKQILTPKQGITINQMRLWALFMASREPGFYTCIPIKTSSHFRHFSP